MLTNWPPPATRLNSSQIETLSEKDFARLRAFILSEIGVHLGKEKRTMLEGRLRKRTRVLHLSSFSDYCAYLFGPVGQREEVSHLFDVVTTNKTDFFRESRHFDYLSSSALPSLEPSRADRKHPLSVWSAGCSTGEEPYTLAMVLNEFAARTPAFQFRLLATDISNSVLEKAHLAVFSSEVVDPIPPPLLHKYFMRSRDRENPRFRVVPELRKFIEFRRLNLMDADFGMSEPMDVIFCRNVLIYFERASQFHILTRFTQQLRPGGYLFLGHSESLNGLDLPLRLVGPTIYRKPSDTLHPARSQRRA